MWGGVGDGVWDGVGDGVDEGVEDGVDEGVEEGSGFLGGMRMVPVPCWTGDGWGEGGWLGRASPWTLWRSDWEVWAV